MKDVWHFIIPEWAKLDEDEQGRVYDASAGVMGWRYWFPLPLAILYFPALRWVDCPYRQGLTYAGFFLYPLLTFVLFFLNRAALRRACREILAGRGEAICTTCGYNLTGNAPGVCPECGKATSAEED